MAFKKKTLQDLNNGDFKDIPSPEEFATDLDKGGQTAVAVDAPTDNKLVREQVVDQEYNLEVIKDYYGKIDPFYLSKKDPNYEYRFIRDDFKNISMKTGNLLFQKGGWQAVTKTHLLKLNIPERYISPDGLYRVGDQFLVFMPKKLFQEKEEYKRKEAKGKMEGINRNLKEGDPTVGRGIHESFKGLQTEKQLGMEGKK